MAILLSPRMVVKTLSSGHVCTRIEWVRLKGPAYNIFYIVAYIPHKGRTVMPQAEDTIEQLTQLLQTANKSECVILAGDFKPIAKTCTGMYREMVHDSA